MIVWWASFPVLVLSVWFSVKFRLRQVLPADLTTMHLSLTPSFRVTWARRTGSGAQILIFYFIFVAVGAVLLREQRKKAAQSAPRAEGDEVFRSRLYVHPASLLQEPSLRF